jgi:hypothetical protein
MLEKPVKVYNFEVADWHTYFVSDGQILVHNACGAANPTVKQAAAKGRELHKSWEYGGNPAREVYLGSAGRADAVDFIRRIVYELKPNNPQAIRRGWKQLNRYTAELERRYGGTWIKILDVY